MDVAFFQLRPNRPALGESPWTVRVAAMLDLTADYADIEALLEDKRDEVRCAGRAR